MHITLFMSADFTFVISFSTSCFSWWYTPVVIFSYIYIFYSYSQTDAPSKAVVRPCKRLTAQEVCYQRMQMAQQQAAQLSASIKVASLSSSSSFSGEKKRIAHRPHPQISSLKTSTCAFQLWLNFEHSYICYFLICVRASYICLCWSDQVPQMLNQLTAKRCPPVGLSRLKQQLEFYPRPHLQSRRRERHTCPPWRYLKLPACVLLYCHSVLEGLICVFCMSEISFCQHIPVHLWRLIIEVDCLFNLQNILLVWCCLFQSTSMTRPVIPSEFGAKVPTNIRQRYLNAFIDECVKFCPSEEDAFQMVWTTSLQQLDLKLLITAGLTDICSCLLSQLILLVDFVSRCIQRDS